MNERYRGGQRDQAFVVSLTMLESYFVNDVIERNEFSILQLNMPFLSRSLLRAVAK